MDTSTEPSRLEYLSKTELSVLRGLLTGMSDSEIAQSLGTGRSKNPKNIVAKHISQIVDKLGLRDNGQQGKRPRYREKLKEQINLEAVDDVLRTKFSSEGALPLIHSNNLPPLTKTIPLDDPRYIEREADQKCFAILQEGSTRQDSRPLIRLRSQWGMGKSSLLSRLHRKLTEKGYIVGRIDLSDTAAFENAAFEDFDLLMRRLAGAIVRSFAEQLDELDFPKLEDYWKPNAASAQNATSYLTEAFGMISGHKVLLIDGLDRVLGKEETQLPLFDLIRSWNENKLKLVVAKKPIVYPSMVLAYSTEPYPAYGVKGSVLQNVGTVVELKEFTTKEIEALASKYRVRISKEQIEQLMKLVGGLPALVNYALHDFSHNSRNQAINFNAFEEYSTQTNGIFWEHLAQHSAMLEEHPVLLENFKKILRGETCADEWSKFQLDKAGLITINGKEVKVKCELYQRYYARKFSVSTMGESHE
ncbi:MAG: hypothetical protein HC916_14335 [Coleofasciculaceae cyanobacterium SM2_1_6]|nr:hypothetical protein [Coleofasciculaceae cyanobacterium SM2_1_6]